MVARVDDRASTTIRTDLEVARRVARVERDRPRVHHAALEQEPIACVELLLRGACERAPCGVLGRAVCGVITGGADIVSLCARHGAYGAWNERAYESAETDHRERRNAASHEYPPPADSSLNN